MSPLAQKRRSQPQRAQQIRGRLVPHANKRSPAREPAGPSARDQVAVGFGFFLAFGFFATAGLMLTGLRAGRAAAASPAAGSWRKKRPHSGESCDLFWIMQAVIRSTSGI